MAYHRGFIIPEIAQIHRHFDRVLRELGVATRNPRTRAYAQRTLRQVRALYAEFNDELDMIARRTAVDATRFIKQRIRETQIRPDNGARPRMSDQVVCRPVKLSRLATGTVGIVDEDEMDKVINPLSSPRWGPFWRAQEYGTDAHVGREIRGFFAGPGGGQPWSPPQSRFTGGGSFQHDETFLARGRGPAGVIQTPLEPRNFIRDGADKALAEWRGQINALQGRTLARLLAIVGP